MLQIKETCRGWKQTKWSYKFLISDLSWEIKLTSIKRLTKVLINGYSILNGERYFVEDGSQNCLVFQSDFKYFQTFTGTDKFFARKSKVLLKESIKTPTISDNSFALRLAFIYNRRIGIKFKENCFIQDNISFTYRTLVNSFIVYKLNTWSRDLNTDFTLGDCSFGAVKLPKNGDLDKYRYGGFGIKSFARSQFSLSNGKLGKKVVGFGVL